MCFRFRAQNSVKLHYGELITTRRQKSFSTIKANDLQDLKKVLTRDCYIYYNFPKQQSHSTHRSFKVTRWMDPSVKNKAKMVSKQIKITRTLHELFWGHFSITYIIHLVTCTKWRLLCVWASTISQIFMLSLVKTFFRSQYGFRTTLTSNFF